jgi:hypothetical protein
VRGLYFSIVFLFDVGEERGVGEVALTAGADIGTVFFVLGSALGGTTVHENNYYRRYITNNN